MMDIEKLIHCLQCCARVDAHNGGCDDCGLDYCGPECQQLCGTAATALSTLKAENEKLRAEVEAVRAERDAAEKEITLCTGFNCSRPCDQRKSWERLKAIEDILGDEYDLDRLRELAEADREGRCVVLPCKVGDTLYRIQRFKRGKNWRKEAEFIRTVELNRNNFWRIVMDGEIGATVFLTRAEAEAALRREQDGE